MESITCTSCSGDINSDKKCLSCNGTGSVIIKKFIYIVPSDFNENILKIYDDRIDRTLIELHNLSKIDIKLKQDTNNYNKG